ncbi:hypothetical protein L596_009794 [Steinernema carpocapsae]|uniref:Uncharacterized protein n=1 Tax=Steinernema carpocapsae TaxID=34508 RepID=A0A4U5PGD0_STECR|nr:hypothetical protein L596_009794 [Steinernema carpocapsae]
MVCLLLKNVIKMGLLSSLFKKMGAMLAQFRYTNVCHPSVRLPKCLATFTTIPYSKQKQLLYYLSYENSFLPLALRLFALFAAPTL